MKFASLLLNLILISACSNQNTPLVFNCCPSLVNTIDNPETIKDFLFNGAMYEKAFLMCDCKNKGIPESSIEKFINKK